MSLILVQHCTNVIQMLYVYWADHFMIISRVVNPFSTKVTPKSAPPFSRPPPPTRQTVASVTAEAASPILPTKPKPIAPIVAPPLTALDSCMDMDDDDIGDFSTQSSDKENHRIDKPSQASQKGNYQP